MNLEEELGRQHKEIAEMNNLIAEIETLRDQSMTHSAIAKALNFIKEQHNIAWDNVSRIEEMLK